MDGRWSRPHEIHLGVLKIWSSDLASQITKATAKGSTWNIHSECTTGPWPIAVVIFRDQRVEDIIDERSDKDQTGLKDLKQARIVKEGQDLSELVLR